MSTELMSIILWAIFAVILVASLLAGLIGFLKGIYKTSLKTLIKAILLIIFIFTTPAIARGVGNIDFSNFNVTFNVSKTTITLTTIQQTLADVITATGVVTPMNGLSLYETATAISCSLVSYVVFLLLCILIQIFATPITAIIYHGILKWFIPVESKKDQKKKKKEKNLYQLTNGVSDENKEVIFSESKKKWSLFKWPSAALGVVQEFVFLCIMISPITALSRVFVKNSDGINDVMQIMNVNEKTKNTVNSCLTAINSSPLYNLLGVANFDTSINYQTTLVTVNGQHVTFERLVSSMFDIAQPIVDGESLTYDATLGKVVYNLNYLLSKEMVNTITSKIILNNVLVALVPPMIDIGLNMVANNNFSMPKLDFSNIDWSNELTALNEIYGMVYDKGVVSQFISDDGRKFSASNFAIKCSEFTDDDVLYYSEIVKKVASLEIFKKNASKLCASLGSYSLSSGINLLPDKESAYENVDWEYDMPIIADNIFNALRALKLDLSSQLNSSLLSNQLTDTFKNAERRDVLKTAIIGSSAKKGILDTTLFQVMDLSKIVSSSLKSITSIKQYVKEVDFSEILSNLTLDEMKDEFNSMFEIIAKIFDNNSLVDLSKLQNIDLHDEEVSKVIVDVLESSKKSRVFNVLFPKIMKNILLKSKYDFSDYMFNVTPYDINYDAEDFTSTISKIVSLMPSIATMKDKIDAASTTVEKLKAVDSDLVRELLKVIVKTDTFNSPASMITTSTSKNNLIAAKMLEGLFNSKSFDYLSYRPATIDEINDVDWKEGVKGDEGEIDLICTFIDYMKINPYVFEYTRFDDIEDYDTFSSMIKLSLKTTFLSKSILYYIDNSLMDYFDRINVPISIDQMRTSMWLKEDDGLCDIDRMTMILKIMKNKSLNSIDINTFEIEQLNSILTILNDCNFVKVGFVTQEDPFGYLLTNILSTNTTLKGLENVFTYNNFNSTLNNYDWSSLKSNTLVVDEKNYPITTKGAIKDLSDFVNIVQLVGVENISGGKFPSSDLYEDKIPSIKDGTYYESKLIKVLYTSVLKDVISNLQLPDDYSKLKEYFDYDYLANLNSSDFKNEVQLLQNMSTIDKATFTLLFDNLSSLSDNNLQDQFESLMNDVAKSKFFKKRKDNYEMSPLSYLFLTITDNNSLLYPSTLLVNADASRRKMIAILNNVADFETEITKNILPIVKNIQGMNILSISMFSKDNTLSYDKALDLFTAFNNSALYHNVSIMLMQLDFTRKAFDVLTVDTVGTTHPIDYSIYRDGNSETDKKYWQNEIENYLGLAYLDSNFKEKIITANKLMSDSDIKLSSDCLSTSFIYYLSEMNIFKSSRSYILYNLMLKSSSDPTRVASLLQNTTNPIYKEDDLIYRIEELFFADSSFNVSDAKTRKELKQRELSMLETPLYEVLTALVKLNTVTSITDMKLNKSYESIFSSAVISTASSSYYRSNLTSEIIASYMKMFKEKFSTFFESSLDFYADNYFLVNPLEGRAIDALIELKATANASSTLSKAVIQPIFKKLGTNLSSTETDIVKIFASSYSFSSTKYNSRIASYTTTINSFFTFDVIDKEGSIVSISTLVDFPSLIVSQTYDEIIEGLDIV